MAVPKDSVTVRQLSNYGADPQLEKLQKELVDADAVGDANRVFRIRAELNKRMDELDAQKASKPTVQPPSVLAEPTKELLPSPSELARAQKLSAEAQRASAEADVLAKREEREAKRTQAELEEAQEERDRAIETERAQRQRLRILPFGSARVREVRALVKKAEAQRRESVEAVKTQRDLARKERAEAKAARATAILQRAAAKQIRRASRSEKRISRAQFAILKEQLAQLKEARVKPVAPTATKRKRARARRTGAQGIRISVRQQQVVSGRPVKVKGHKRGAPRKTRRK